MTSILEYYIMRNEAGATMWLSDDMQTWAPHLHSAAAFTSAKLADDIARRQLGYDRVFYVMGCVSSGPFDE